MKRALKYTEHPGQQAMDWLAEQAAERDLDRRLAERRIITQARAECARKGR